MMMKLVCIKSCKNYAGKYKIVFLMQFYNHSLKASLKIKLNINLKCFVTLKTD